MTSLLPTPRDWFPGLIAAGVLHAAETFLLDDPTRATPVIGFLAAATVYYADHRISRHETAPPPLYGILVVASTLLFSLIVSTPRVSLARCLGFALLALGYVLPFSDGRNRLQEFPWLRVVLVAAGWGAAPLILVDFPLTLPGIGFLLGTAALFFAGVQWSDTADRSEDRRSGRRTPASDFTPARLATVAGLAYAISLTAYALTGRPELLVAPAAAWAATPWLLHGHHARFADGLLLLPGLIAGATRVW